MTNLEKSLENLYRVFAKYSLKDQIEGCPCCVGKGDNRMLHTKPLRELSGKDLSYFGFKAITTFGDVDDFRHFLPRLFEIMVNQEFLYNEEILCKKLEYAKWETWDENEKSAIENFFFELFRVAINFNSENAYLTETYLVCIAQAVDDLTPYLKLWFENVSTNKIKTLHYFVVECDCGTSSAFLADKPQQRNQIREWLTSNQTVMAIEALFITNKEVSYKNEITEILEKIYELGKI